MPILSRFPTGDESIGIPDNKSVVNIKVTSYDDNNLNRLVSIQKTNQTKEYFQLKEDGKASIMLDIGTYQFSLSDVPNGYKFPQPQSLELFGGKKTNLDFFMEYTSVDHDKTKVIVDVSTFDDNNKEELTVNIGTETALTDANGHVEKLMPAYSSPGVLASYPVSVIPKKGYKNPGIKTVNAVSAGECAADFFLAEQLISDGKCIISGKVDTYDGLNKENLTVSIYSTARAEVVATTTTDAQGNYKTGEIDAKYLEEVEVFEISVPIVPSGYGVPAKQTITAVPEQELIANFMLKKQVVPPGKSQFNIKVNTYDGLNKENIEVDVNGTKYRTDANGLVTLIVDVY